MHVPSRDLRNNYYQYLLIFLFGIYCKVPDILRYVVVPQRSILSKDKHIFHLTDHFLTFISVSTFDNSGNGLMSYKECTVFKCCSLVRITTASLSNWVKLTELEYTFKSNTIWMTTLSSVSITMQSIAFYILLIDFHKYKQQKLTWSFPRNVKDFMMCTVKTPLNKHASCKWSERVGRRH